MRTVTLDDYLKHSGLNADVIKMDIQGAEYFALQGMLETLSSSPDIVLMTEYWPHGLEAYGVQPIQFIRQLCKIGYRVFTVSRDCCLDETTDEEIASSVEGKDYLTILFSKRGIKLDPLSTQSARHERNTWTASVL